MGGPLIEQSPRTEPYLQTDLTAPTSGRLTSWAGLGHRKDALHFLGSEFSPKTSTSAEEDIHCVSAAEISPSSIPLPRIRGGDGADGGSQSAAGLWIGEGPRELGSLC